MRVVTGGEVIRRSHDFVHRGTSKWYKMHGKSSLTLYRFY
jgi:hypothetical protein